MGNEILLKQTYFRQLSQFFILKDITTNFSLEIPEHVMQNDGFNCGIYIILFSKYYKKSNINSQFRSRGVKNKSEMDVIT